MKGKCFFSSCMLILNTSHLISSILLFIYIFKNNPLTVQAGYPSSGLPYANICIIIYNGGTYFGCYFTCILMRLNFVNLSIYMYIYVHTQRYIVMKSPSLDKIAWLAHVMICLLGTKKLKSYIHSFKYINCNVILLIGKKKSKASSSTATNLLTLAWKMWL